MFYPVKKQVYKLEFAKNWEIHNVFYMLVLEQNNSKKK